MVRRRRKLATLTAVLAAIARGSSRAFAPARRADRLTWAASAATLRRGAAPLPRGGLESEGEAAVRPRSARQSAARERSVEGASALLVPPAPFLALMAVAGALLGPILDGFHSRFGVLRYHEPPPFAVSLGGFELCQTAAWVPPMFGLAGIIIGTLYVLLDRVLNTPAEKRAPSASTVILGIVCFVLQYFVSGLLLGPLGVFGPGVLEGGGASWWLAGVVELLLWATSLLHWRIFDGSTVGAIVSVLTALGGPAIELTILNMPGWDVYAYAAPDFFGIPSWICAVYFCGGPAVGNLARAVLRAVSSSEVPSSRSPDAS